VLAVFLAALGVGILWALWLLPRGEVRPDYAAWMGVTAFAVLAFLLGSQWMASRTVNPWTASAAGGALLYRALAPTRMATLGLVLASLLGAACLGSLCAGSSPWGAASVLLSALVLGTALDAMVLGHWYLVQHGLSFRPLQRMTLALLGVLAARLLLAGFCAWRMPAALFGGWLLMVVLLRGLLGLLGPLGLGWMVWECVKIKSNTSATGILYVVCVFVLVGEFSSAYLLQLGHPL